MLKVGLTPLEGGRRDSYTALVAALQRLPDDVEPELAASAALSLVQGSHTWKFARNARQLPPRVIRALLSRLAASPEKSAHALFLIEATSGTTGELELTLAWQSALEALLDLQTSYAWGSKQRRAKLLGVARNPRFRAAVQAAVVGSQDASADLLAVLAADGSDESIDALLPLFDRAEKERSALLDKLDRLKTHAAKTPAMTAMLTSIEQRLTQRCQTSPALAFARDLGFEVDRFTVRVSLGSTAVESRGVPRIQGSLTIDSTRPSWFDVWVSRPDPKGRAGFVTTSFGAGASSQDDLQLGRCEAAQLPTWLAQAQRKLRIAWTPAPPHVGGSLRGKKRDQFVDWLMGPSRGR